MHRSDKKTLSTKNTRHPRFRRDDQNDNVMSSHSLFRKRSIMRLTFLILGLPLFLAACGSSEPPPPTTSQQRAADMAASDDVGDRFIHLRHAVSGESFAGFYAVSGQYTPQALDAVNRLLRDQRTGDVAQIDPKLLNFMVDVRRTLALPDDQPILVLSGYRTPRTGTSSTEGGRANLHHQGMAIDLQIAGHNSRTVAEVANTLQRGGVVYFPKTDHVHLDIGPPRYAEGK